jgi:hypothetical protein
MHFSLFWSNCGYISILSLYLFALISYIIWGFLWEEKRGMGKELPWLESEQDFPWFQVDASFLPCEIYMAQFPILWNRSWLSCVPNARNDTIPFQRNGKLQNPYKNPLIQTGSKLKGMLVHDVQKIKRRTKGLSVNSCWWYYMTSRKLLSDLYRGARPAFGLDEFGAVTWGPVRLVQVQELAKYMSSRVHLFMYV